MVKKLIKNSKENYIFKILLVFIFLLFLNHFIFANILVLTNNGESSYFLNEDTNSIINISITDQDTESINLINISFPQEINLDYSKNGTSSVNSTFKVSDSNVLTWYNEESLELISSSETNYFWIGLSAENPGNYNLTINAFTLTKTFNSNITLIINDITPPNKIEFLNPSIQNSQSSKSLIFNISATDNGIIDTIKLDIFNSSGLVNSTPNQGSLFYTNIEDYPEGTYYINATVNDTSNNLNSTTTRTIIIDRTIPEITLSEPSDDSVITSTSYNFTFTISDTSDIDNCKLIFKNNILETKNDIVKSEKIGIYTTSLTEGKDTWYINCTDSAGNTKKSSARVLNISLSSESNENTADNSDENTAETTENNFWILTKLADENQSKEGYSAELKKGYRIRIKVNGDSHYVGVISLNKTSAIINVSSDPQQETFDINDEKKFEVTGDNYYDINVKLNSINESIANVTAQAIHELKPEKTTSLNATTTSTASDSLEATKNEENSNKESKKWILILVGVLILISGITGGIILFIKKKK